MDNMLAHHSTTVTHDFAVIVDVSCESATSDPCGPVSSGHITLRGYVSEMTVEDSKLKWMPDGRIEMKKDGTKSAYVNLDSKDDYEDIWYFVVEGLAA